MFPTGTIPARCDRKVVTVISVPNSQGRRFDLVSLGEVMLRLDPGPVPVRVARSFHVWEGGGEYNVARALRKVFGRRTAIMTSLVDNEVGRLVEDLILQGGVDTDYIRWTDFDGIGAGARNALNFTDRGFGVRAARGCSDRGNSACSQLRTGDLDLSPVTEAGTRWLHTGGVFAALGPQTPEVVEEVLIAAKAHGAVVSYDLNYRASLWEKHGGRARAREVNRRLAPLVDVMIGNEEDFGAALGFEVHGVRDDYQDLDITAFEDMIHRVVTEFPSIGMVATTLRAVRTATSNDWGAILWADGAMYAATPRPALEVFDRVGGGDGFASGLIHALLDGVAPERAVEVGAAHGALAMTTPGDTSFASAGDVERLTQGGSPRVIR